MAKRSIERQTHAWAIYHIAATPAKFVGIAYGELERKSGDETDDQATQCAAEKSATGWSPGRETDCTPMLHLRYWYHWLIYRPGVSTYYRRAVGERQITCSTPLLRPRMPRSCVSRQGHPRIVDAFPLKAGE
jgi:hypothetical protein